MESSGREVEHAMGEVGADGGTLVAGLAEVVRREGVETDSCEGALSAAASIS